MPCAAPSCALPTQQRIAAPGRASAHQSHTISVRYSAGKAARVRPSCAHSVAALPPFPLLTSPLFRRSRPWLPRAPLPPPPPPRCCWRAAPPQTRQTAARASASSKVPSAAADGPKGACIGQRCALSSVPAAARRGRRGALGRARRPGECSAFWQHAPSRFARARTHIGASRAARPRRLLAPAAKHAPLRHPRHRRRRTSSASFPPRSRRGSLRLAAGAVGPAAASAARQRGSSGLGAPRCAPIRGADASSPRLRPARLRSRATHYGGDPGECVAQRRRCARGCACA